MINFLAVLLPLLASLTIVTAQSGTSCSASSQCPSSMPCCSEFGFCGTGSFCLGGCNPFGSNALTSCKPNPVCQNSNYTFNDTSRIQFLADYNGDASKYDWVLQGGNITVVDNSLAILLTETNGGTRLSSTRYVHYGKMTARMKTGRWAGVVTAFITMSDIHDEIDYEWPGGNTTQAQSNWFWQGNVPAAGSSHGEIHKGISDTYDNWHDYTIDWKPDSLTFSVDNNVVRTIPSNSSTQYPNTPSRVELSLWPAGISSSAPGTVQWAGGMIDWSSPDFTAAGGHFQALIQSVSVVCEDPSSAPSGTTSYVYGSNSTTNTPSISFSSSTTTIDISSSGGSSNGSSNGSSVAGGSASGSSLGGSADGSSDGSSGSGLSGKKIGIIAGGVVGGIAALVLGALVVRACVRGFSKSGQPSAKAAEAYGFAGHGSEYRPLNAPAPQAASETHALPHLHYDGGRYN